MLQGFLGKGLVDWQQNYNIIMGTGKTGRKWVRTVIKKLLSILHSSWVERCKIVHAMVTGGLYIEEDRKLKETVRSELRHNTEEGVEKEIIKLWKKTDGLDKKMANRSIY